MSESQTPAVKWTKDRPEKEGWYWWSRYKNAQSPEISYFKYEGGRYIAWGAARGLDGMEWFCGPLKTPALPSTEERISRKETPNA